MKYLFMILFLVGCSTPQPGKTNGIIVGMTYYNYNRDDSRIQIFSEEYGNLNVYYSPYFESLNIGDKVVVACDTMKDFFMKPSGCHIIARQKKELK